MARTDRPITFHSRMTIRPEMVEPFLASISRLFDRVVDCPGCHFAYLAQATREPDTFMLFEQWTNKDALEDWKHTEAFTTYWAETEPMYAKARIDQGWRILKTKSAT